MREITIYSVNRADPTHTTMLREAFAKDMNRKFRELTTVIAKTIIEKDCFGLQELSTLQMTPSGYRQFAFPLDAEKVEAFMTWLQDQVDKGIINVSEIPGLGGSKYAWTNMYISDSYKRGIIRARMELRRKGMNIPDTDVELIMGTPFHLDRVGLLFIRTFTELKNITEAMSNQISKVLAQGMVDGDGPRLIARKLVSTINGTGVGELGITDTLGRFIPAKRRAEMLARTEIIRAHHIATIQEYRSWGIAGVEVMAEFVNAGDDRVCPICSSLQGKLYTLDEAEGLIPVHVNCRCCTIPLVVENRNLM